MKPGTQGKKLYLIRVRERDSYTTNHSVVVVAYNEYDAEQIFLDHALKRYGDPCKILSTDLIVPVESDLSLPTGVLGTSTWQVTG